MRFWDSSALVPLIVHEDSSTWARQLIKTDHELIVWSLSEVEVRSALSRRHRDGGLSASDFKESRRRAHLLLDPAAQVVALDIVRDRALRLLDSHDLRAADSLQLAAALVAARERPGLLPFVTLDLRLAEAAEREGFVVEMADE